MFAHGRFASLPQVVVETAAGGNAFRMHRGPTLALPIATMWGWGPQGGEEGEGRGLVGKGQYCERRRNVSLSPEKTVDNGKSSFLPVGLEEEGFMVGTLHCAHTP